MDRAEGALRVAERAMELVNRALQEIAELRIIQGPAGDAGVDGKDGRDGLDGKDGGPGEPGREGPPGKLPKVREWSDGVHYDGHVVSHQGSAFQALRDTAKEPPHDDWRCIAQAGQKGTDGRSLTIRGTWTAKGEYRASDVVALNNGSFVARKDNPGVCPGDDWQLLAGPGKRGEIGERAPGIRGEPGKPGLPVVAVDVDSEGLLTLTNGDGSVVTCDLYPLLDKVLR